MTAAGVWTYTLDNTNAAVQALNVGQTLTDTFTVTTVDGTAQVVTVTINGTNDAAVITSAPSDAVGSVVEDGNPVASGQLTASDPDLGDTQTWTIVGGQLVQNSADYFVTVDEFTVT